MKKIFIFLFIFTISSFSFGAEFYVSQLFMDSEVIVKTVNDFPTPDEFGIIQLENKHYMLDAQIVMPYTLKLPVAGTVKFSASLTDNALVYVGGGTLFINDKTQATVSILSLFDIVLVGFDAGGGAGTVFDISITEQNTDIFVLGSFIVFDGFESLGTIVNHSVFIYTTNIQNCNTGFTFINPAAIEISVPSVYSGTNQNTNFFNISGTSITSINFLFPTSILDTNERFLYIDPEVATGNTRINVSGGTNAGAVFLREGSLDHAYIYASFSNNIGFENSTIKAKISLTDNNETTTILAINTPTDINAIWNDGSIEERFVFQDICTFDNTSDTIITSFEHNLSTNNIVTFHTYSGELPTGLTASTNYYVQNITNGTFQVSLSTFGAIVDFSTDGTGTNYYRHVDGNSDCGCVIYTGTEDSSVNINGWMRILSITGTGVNVNSVIMKIATDGTISTFEQGSIIEVSSAQPFSSTLTTIMPISPGEGIIFYVQNKTSTVNLKVTDARISIIKS